MNSAQIERRRTNSAMNLAELMLCLAIFIIACFSGARSEEKLPANPLTSPDSSPAMSSHTVRITGDDLTLDGIAKPLSTLDSLTGNAEVTVAPETAGAQVSHALAHMKNLSISMSFEEEQK